MRIAQPDERHLIAVSLNRRIASVSVREALARPDIDWAAAIADAAHASSFALIEWALLCTCHRFELYAVVTDQACAAQVLPRLICDVASTATDAGLSPVLPDLFVVEDDLRAAQHLCRVAAGLDSVILGEPQILGQVARTFADGVAAGAIGPRLATLFRAAIRAGKRARAETSISASSANLSSTALNRAEDWAGDLANASVVVIGAGEMGGLALKALHAREARCVSVVNRSLDRAQAARLNPAWQAFPLDALAACLDGADVVLSATRIDGYTVTACHAREMIAARAGRQPGPVFIDLAVPRDIDPAIAEIPGVLLINVDDLHDSVDATRQQRLAALPQVDGIIVEELDRFRTEMRELAVRPVVVELRQKAELIREQEVERTLRFLGSVDEETRRHIHHLSRALVNKLLHAPTTRLKQSAHTEDAAGVADTVRTLFALDATSHSSGGVRHDALES